MRPCRIYSVCVCVCVCVCVLGLLTDEEELGRVATCRLAVVILQHRAHASNLGLVLCPPHMRET